MTTPDPTNDMTNMLQWENEGPRLHCWAAARQDNQGRWTQAILDTGLRVTEFPRELLEELGAEPIEPHPFGGGSPTWRIAFRLRRHHEDLLPMQCGFPVIALQRGRAPSDLPRVGRDVLSHYRIELDPAKRICDLNLWLPPA